jgi:hypothetical protein
MATRTVRIPADPHPQPILLTQHNMVNIGLGNSPDAPLKYVAELWFPDQNHLCPTKAKLYATSEQNAEEIILATYPKAVIDSLRIL